MANQTGSVNYQNVCGAPDDGDIVVAQDVETVAKFSADNTHSLLSLLNGVQAPIGAYTVPASAGFNATRGPRMYSLTVTNQVVGGSFELGSPSTVERPIAHPPTDYGNTGWQFQADYYYDSIVPSTDLSFPLSLPHDSATEILAFKVGIRVPSPATLTSNRVRLSLHRRQLASSSAPTEVDFFLDDSANDAAYNAYHILTWTLPTPEPFLVTDAYWFRIDSDPDNTHVFAPPWIVYRASRIRPGGA